MEGRRRPRCTALHRVYSLRVAYVGVITLSVYTYGMFSSCFQCCGRERALSWLDRWMGGMMRDGGGEKKALLRVRAAAAPRDSETQAAALLREQVGKRTGEDLGPMDLCE